jgi:hypothetical protein
MRLRKLALFVTAIFFSPLLWANPAPWYRWHSPLADIEVCSQTSPGDGWVIVKGPFEDALCRKRGVPH